VSSAANCLCKLVDEVFAIDTDKNHLRLQNVLQNCLEPSALPEYRLIFFVRNEEKVMKIIPLADPVHPRHNRAHASFTGTAAVLAIILAFSSADPRPAQSQAAVDIVKVNVDVVAKGYRASRLIGTSVTNDKNERIGTIDDIVIDKNQNRTLYAVLQVGGFLSLGGHLVAVQFDQLKIDDDGRKIQLPGATNEALRGLNEFRYRG
jgi:sporulation protein YlmC with PRC-barrel domain